MVFGYFTNLKQKMFFGTSKKRLAKSYKLFYVLLLKLDWLITLQYCLLKSKLPLNNLGNMLENIKLCTQGI